MESTHWPSRCVISSQLNCPTEILEKFSEDEEVDVRVTVANNPNCPIEILEN